MVARSAQRRRFAGAVASLSLLLQLGCLLLVFRSHWVPAALSLTVAWWLCLGLEKGRQALLLRQRLLALQSAANVQDPLVLKTIGEYQLVERIGQGGFASVYRALPTSTLDPGAAVAIKVVHPSAAESEEFRRRFLREIRISGQLCHPSIVRVFDSGDHDGLLYLVMELVRGRSLRKMMDERETWDLESTTVVIRQVLQAMAYAHTLSVLHRDLKPENVMVGMDLSLKVVDFGLAFDEHSSKLTKSNDLLGTLGYLAPERIQGSGDDHRSDQYAVGVMAYELLAGKSPFPQESTGEALLFRLTQDPVPLETLRPDLSERLVGVITRMMAREVGQRFPTTGEALAAWDLATENVGKP